MNNSRQLVHAPKSSPNMEIKQLAYLESFDAVMDRDYAFVIYKETGADTGKWVVRIKGSLTAGTVIEPESFALKSALKKAAKHNEPYIVWGFNLKPSEKDPRLIETRVLIDASGKPTAMELHLITRKSDQSPRDKKVTKVPWPET
ncbi:MAG: hypothetical protein GY794_09800 [bacterium]|nr:hypothetical protein [bacterium]